VTCLCKKLSSTGGHLHWLEGERKATPLTVVVSMKGQPEQDLSVLRPYSESRTLLLRFF
jgi:hypothetical protein